MLVNCMLLQQQAHTALAGQIYGACILLNLHYLQISGDDPDDYKRTLKGQLKRALEAEKEVAGGAPEFVIAYIQAAGSDSSSNFLRSSKKVQSHD